MALIFVSHSSRDGAQASKLMAWLRAIGMKEVFLDFDKHAGIAPGADWERTLYREIAAAEAVILILTANWFDSKWCFAEFAQARALGKAIFPLVETPTGESFVASDIQHLDLIKDREGGLERLASELTKISTNARGDFHWDVTRSPFPGMLAFDESDAAIYFGRDDDIRRLIERLNARRAQGGTKLLAVLGASGSGKSSLLRAGVLPRLKRDKQNWIVVPPFRPRLRPVTEMAQALATALERGGDWSSIGEKLRGADAAVAIETIGRDLRALHHANEAQILITIDQGEELFGDADPAEAEQFFKLLDLLLDEHLPFLVAIALRSDALGQLQNAPLQASFEEFSLKPMPIDRVRNIIEGPAKIVHLEVEEGMIEAASKDAATDDALPLLAFALRELYDRDRQTRHLTLAHYLALGDPQEKLSPIENAVRQRADAVFKESHPDPAEVQALKEAFVPAMVRVNAEGEYVRRAARMDAMPAKAHPLLLRLARARLLVIGQDSRIEVAHEALLRKWPLLRGWLDEEREFLIGKDQLETDLHDWKKASETQKNDALLAGLKLTRARSWLLERPRQLSEEERDFIAASARFHDAEAARRERFRRNVQIGTIAAAAILAIVAAFAWWERGIATTALADAERNYGLALDQAVGNFQLLEENYDEGNISTAILSALVERSAAAVNARPSAADTEAVTVARTQLADIVALMQVSIGDGRAVETARNEVALAEILRQKDPKNLKYLWLWAQAHGELSDVLFWQCDCVAAAEEARLSAGVAAQVLKQTPDDAILHERLLTDYETRGDALREMGDLDGADEAYGTELQDLEATLQRQPNEKRWLADVSFTTERIGDQLLLKGRPVEAQAQYDRDYSIASKLVGDNPQDANYLSALVQSLQRRGDAWLARGDLQHAADEYDAYLKRAETLSKSDPANFRFADFYALAYQRIGDLELQNKNYTGAARQFATYLAMAQDLLKKNPSNNLALYDVANAYAKRGDAKRADGDLAGALEEYRQALTHARDLAGKDCQNGSWQRLLALVYQRIALTLEAQKDAAGAGEQYRRCAAVKVKEPVWSPAAIWPPQVVQYCNDALAKLGPARP